MERKAIFRFFDKYIGIPVIIILAILFKRKKRLPIENIKKIIIIKLAAIGDTILLIPLLRTLKKKLPEVELTFVCSPINYSIVKKIPYVDKIINCHVYSFKNPFNFLKFLREIRKEKYDVLIDTGQWERINSIMSVFIKKYFSIGFKTDRQFKHYTYDSVAVHYRDKHELENFLDLLNPLGIEITEEDKKLEYFLTEKNKQFADKFWNEHNLNDKTVLCMHPGCGQNGQPREWANENYIKLGRRLVEYNSDFRILLTGAEIDIERCKIIEEGIGKNIVNTAGKYPIDDIISIIQKCELIVCSNTGMLHIAGCVGTKTMGLHGPTNPKKWGSYSKNSVLIQSGKFCSPCLYLGHDYGCRTPDCMKYITVDDVFIYIRKALTPELFSYFKAG